LNLVKLVVTSTVIWTTGESMPAAEPRANPPAEKTTADRLTQLIVQLGSDQFAEREAATRELSALGPVALDSLRRASEAEDPELQRRARKLLRQVEKRLTADQLLEPKRIRLVYRDTPVTEAVADLARSTGLPVRIAGDPAPLAERRLSLDTGDTTLWDALAQFCRKAGLTERGPDAAAFQDDRYEYNAGPRRIVAFDRTAWGSDPRPKRPLLLEDGAWQELPTCHAGGLRIRALPPGIPTPATPVAGEELLALEVLTEPHIQWDAVLAVRVDRAVGAKSPLLKRRAVSGALGSAAGTGPEEMLVVWDGSGEFPANPFGDARYVLLRLRLADMSPRRLQELSGTIAARIRTPFEKLASVDRILQAAGSTVRSADGSALQVIEAMHTDQGPYRIRVALTAPPPELVSGGMPARLVVLARPWWGRDTEAGSPESTAFTLLDARGRRFSLASGEVQGTLAKGLRHDFTLVFQPLPDRAPPIRLLYNARRPVTVEVPFTLRDVPLP
jgi:hypothetical protein